MEGLPRMPMLSVELKYCPVSTDFGPKFKEYISRAYQDNPDAYDKEIDELNQLRDNAIKAPADFTGCSALKKYFAQLYLLRNRFPMEENDSASVPFTWYEKFSDMPSPVTYEDVRYDMACILHNIGAVHSYLATVDSRLTSDGMKVSCTHFQCAAWAFQILRDNSEPYRFSSSSFSPDFEHHIMDWYAVLMLAQAQECILEKSLLDNRKSHIIAKVAVQVSDFYAQAIRVLEQPSVSDVVGSTKCRSWRKFSDMKRRFYRAIAYYELGCQADEQHKMGERLAYFQAASTELEEATKLGHKESSEAIQQSLQFAEDVIVGRLNNAKKENDFIYHDKVPPMESLPELKGASLVKAIVFDPLDADVSGGDIFKRLIPLEIHQTSSMYSEEKAKLLREISEEVDTKNNALEDFVASLKLEQLMLDVDFDQMPLPETLIERCAVLNAKPTSVTDLLEQMKKLTTSYETVETTIGEIEMKLNDSEQESRTIMKELYGASEDSMGSKVPNDVRATIINRLKSIRDELDRHRRAHEQATKANAELHKALTAHSENLNVLSMPLIELKKHLPSPPKDVAGSAETAEMKRLLEKTDEMKRQRDMLMEQLRQQIREDDVTKILLAEKDKDEKELFSKEIKKHEKQIAIIKQNVAAQENIIKALTEANAKYGEIRKQVNAASKQRDMKIRSLVGTYDVFSDLETKAKVGNEFYEKLKKSLQDLDAGLSKWCQTDFVSFCGKSKLELEKRSAAALEIRKTSELPAMNEPSGPKLKDYMAYYRAKKAGQAAMFPPSSSAAMPTVSTFPASTVGPPPVPSFPTTATTGTYPATYAPTGPNGIFPCPSMSYASGGLNGTYHQPSNAYSTAAPYFSGHHTTPTMAPMAASRTPTASAHGQHYMQPSGNVHQAMPAPGRPEVYAQPSSMASPAVYNYVPPGTSSMSVPNAMMPQSAMVNPMAQNVPAPVSTVIPAGVPAASVQAMPPQVVPTGYGYSGIYLEPVAFGSNYVQLRWRYDGPKPAKYLLTFRGYQKYDAGMGRVEEREVDTGAPVKLDAEHYIVHNLHPDTLYAFEVSVIDEASGRIFMRSPTIRVNTNSSLL